MRGDGRDVMALGDRVDNVAAWVADVAEKGHLKIQSNAIDCSQGGARGGVLPGFVHDEFVIASLTGLDGSFRKVKRGLALSEKATYRLKVFPWYIVQIDPWFFEDMESDSREVLKPS